MVADTDYRVHMVKSFYPYATTHNPLGNISQSNPQKKNALRGGLEDHFSEQEALNEEKCHSSSLSLYLRLASHAETKNKGERKRTLR